jgi:hypothetical protein
VFCEYVAYRLGTHARSSRVLVELSTMELGHDSASALGLSLSTSTSLKSSTARLSIVLERGILCLLDVVGHLVRVIASLQHPRCGPDAFCWLMHPPEASKAEREKVRKTWTVCEPS